MVPVLCQLVARPRIAIGRAEGARALRPLGCVAANATQRTPRGARVAQSHTLVPSARRRATRALGAEGALRARVAFFASLRCRRHLQQAAGGGQTKEVPSTGRKPGINPGARRMGGPPVGGLSFIDSGTHSQRQSRSPTTENRGRFSTFDFRDVGFVANSVPQARPSDVLTTGDAFLCIYITWNHPSTPADSKTRMQDLPETRSHTRGPTHARAHIATSDLS